MSCRFDLAHYRELLEAAQAGGYGWASFDRHPRQGDLFLRHDVDLSLEAALEMARGRARAGRARDVFPDDRERLLQPRLARRPLCERAAARSWGHAVGLPRRVSARRARRALRQGRRVAQPRPRVHGAAGRRRRQRDGAAVLHAGPLPLRLEPALARGLPARRARARRVRVAAAARSTRRSGCTTARRCGETMRRDARRRSAASGSSISPTTGSTSSE